MLTLLSPAKKLDESPVSTSLSPTRPALLDQTEQLMQTARHLTRKDLAELMSLSDNLASLNHERFQAWQTEHTPDNSLPAALTFAGDVYQGLDARSLDDDALAWAQDRVVILSGLYGLLRPLDLIQPYRLEMGTRLKTERGKSLYDFWGTRLAEGLDARLADHDDPTIVNLASQEYFGAVPSKALVHPVLDVAFQDVSDGKARTISFYAKRARGAMTRWIIEQRVDRAEGLKDAVVDDYRYDAQASTPRKWVFRRPKPPPKSKR